MKDLERENRRLRRAISDLTPDKLSGDLARKLPSPARRRGGIDQLRREPPIVSER
jgi:hypothetical protein